MSNSHMIALSSEGKTFQFSVNTANYQQLKHQVDYGWSESSQSGKSGLQAGGRGQESIDLEGVIFPFFDASTNKDNLADYGQKVLQKMGSIADLRKLAAARKAVSLVALSADGKQGTAFGFWVIRSIEEGQSLFFQAGVPQKQTFNLKLSYFGKNSESSSTDFVSSGF